MKTSEVERQITLPQTGGSVQVRSADDPNSLRGDSLDLAILDEAAFMREEAWQQGIRPALADRRGAALFISTPFGRNWFWRLFLNAQSEEDWAAFQFPTSSNPYIPASEIEASRKLLPDMVFRQEFLAEFLDDAGGVFRGVMAAATAVRMPCLADHSYVMGVDWGKYNDFTAIAVIDAHTRQMVEMDRFNQIDYAFQLERLKTLSDRYAPTQIIAERNSMGDPLVEQLQRMGLPVTPFVTTNESKRQAIEALSLAIERQEIAILNDPVLVGELQAFQAERLPSGLLRYGAPDGMHDDTVMALAMAWQGVVAGVMPSDFRVGNTREASNVYW